MLKYVLVSTLVLVCAGNKYFIQLIGEKYHHFESCSSNAKETNKCFEEFPEDFLFGVASSAYQVEGAWNESGKSLSSWDYFTRTRSEIIADRSTADISSDSYHKTEEDVQLLKNLGVHFYRFSLSWPRIMPSSNIINMEGIDYYNRLIDLLLENGIKPMVTIFHWDIPQHLQELGGFANPLIIDPFVEYANVAFKHFGDRVKLWSTINEPKIYCTLSYGNVLFPPGINQSGIGDYLCGHNLLKAHARVYHLYNDTFRSEQKGKISINLDSPWGEPASNSTEDLDSAERYMQFELGWFAHPIFTKKGDYPPIVKQLVAKRSQLEGYLHSRLPTFTQKEIEYIRGTYDYFFLNHYMVKMVTDQKEKNSKTTSYYTDSECDSYFDPSWTGSASSLFWVVPSAFRKLLVWIKDHYNNPEIYVTENGYADTGEILDTKRVSYYRKYLKEVLKAICNHGVNVKGYTAWSFLDSFEWFMGYTIQFGLYHVNFSDPLRPRTAKSSAEYFKKLIATRRP